MDWKFEKICIQYLTQGWNVNMKRIHKIRTKTAFE